jgi:hypothetical protein
MEYRFEVTEGAANIPELRREWWERRRGPFSLAVLAGYAIAVIVYELFTPWWAGDHVGISAPSLIILYGPGALVVVAVANAAYWLPRLIEPRDPGRVDTFRRRAFLASIIGGAAFAPVLIGVGVFEAWLRHR